MTLIQRTSSAHVEGSDVPEILVVVGCQHHKFVIQSQWMYDVGAADYKRLTVQEFRLASGCFHQMDLWKKDVANSSGHIPLSESVGDPSLQGGTRWLLLYDKCKALNKEWARVSGISGAPMPGKTCPRTFAFEHLTGWTAEIVCKSSLISVHFF